MSGINIVRTGYQLAINIANHNCIMDIPAIIIVYLRSDTKIVNRVYQA